MSLSASDIELVFTLVFPELPAKELQSCYLTARSWQRIINADSELKDYLQGKRIVILNNNPFGNLHPGLEPASSLQICIYNDWWSPLANSAEGMIGLLLPGEQFGELYFGGYRRELLGRDLPNSTCTVTHLPSRLTCCVICRNELHELDIEMQADPTSPRLGAGVVVAGACGNVYHARCIQRFVTARSLAVCPLCALPWDPRFFHIDVAIHRELNPSCDQTLTMTQYLADYLLDAACWQSAYSVAKKHYVSQPDEYLVIAVLTDMVVAEFPGATRGRVGRLIEGLIDDEFLVRNENNLTEVRYFE